MKFFDYDSPMFRVLSFISDLVILNILWLVFCLPIVTIGASTTALYHCMMKKVQKEEFSPFNEFFAAFKSNFKVSTLTWLILGPAGALLTIDFYYTNGIQNPTTQLVFYCVFGIVLVFYVLCMLYIWAVISKFNHTVWNSIKYSVLIAIKNPFDTISMVIILGCLIVFPWLSLQTYQWSLILLVSLGVATIVFLYNKLFIANVFKKYIKLGANDPDMNVEEVNR